MQPLRTPISFSQTIFTFKIRLLSFRILVSSTSKFTVAIACSSATHLASLKQCLPFLHRHSYFAVEVLWSRFKVCFSNAKNHQIFCLACLLACI
jgi:hypothetical protein